MRNRLVARDGYDWERDFPVYLQDQEENGQTLLTLEFEPSKKKREALSTIIGSPLRGHLHVELRFGKEHAEIRARDTASEAVVPRKSLKLVCRFIGNSINCQYIPSLRTADSARKIVEQIVERELSALEEKPVYRSALSQIAKIQRPVLQELSKSVTATLKQFLPSVKKVRLRVSAEERVMALRRACSIIVDDGAETNLKEKGDGVQSLAALSLMRHAALLSAGGKSILLAIEEPETHLHSKALHQLRNVLQEITTKHQVVLTTHNPIFVNRERIVTNIVVTQNQAKPAQSLEEIRQCLGVRPSDNLRQAEIALVVEGHDDRVALTALLSSYSKVLKAALTSGVLGIDPLNGSGNLPYKLSLLRSTALCAVFVFVDNDAAGKSAVEKAIGDGVLTKAEVKYAMCRGKDESELEDFYHQAVYEAAIDKHFSVKLVKPLMRGRKKWSDRMADCFQASGQIWDDAAKTAAKTFVAAEVAAAPKKALNHAIRKPFDALVAALEERVSALGNPAQ
jgi:predicted ATP-dependent endonuclease of OLD family